MRTPHDELEKRKRRTRRRKPVRVFDRRRKDHAHVAFGEVLGLELAQVENAEPVLLL
jgi:hypothetical protein